MLAAYTNGCHTVIAESLEDAIVVFLETTKEPVYEYDDFEEVPPDVEYALTQEFGSCYCKPPENALVVHASEYQVTHKAKTSDWVKSFGRCFLGSTEF